MKNSRRFSETYLKSFNAIAVLKSFKISKLLVAKLVEFFVSKKTKKNLTITQSAAG